jgi:hypothetical protein
MLNALLPRWSTRFLTLPLLGPLADDFDTWASTQGYRPSTRRRWARALIQIDGDLRRYGVRPGGMWRQAALDACWMRYRQRDPDRPGPPALCSGFCRHTPDSPSRPWPSLG